MQAVLFSAAMAAALLGCQAPSAPVTTTALLADRHHAEVRRHRGPLPKDQLARVKRATARYRDVNKALADGYTDINVVLPNMGRHFLKTPILDAAFDVEQPELLVYSPDKKGRLQLVAVEYAVPLNLATEAPAGFRGAADSWFANQQFQLWTLHAWVWKENPQGVFHPTNRRVP